MRILIVDNGVIPVRLYGGTERVVWALGKELNQLGHQVTFLVGEGSSCNFARVIHIDRTKEITEQIPEEVDIIHFNFQPKNLEKVNKPYIITVHGNISEPIPLDRNAVFVSKNHAERYNSTSYVYNGLNWDDYTKPDLSIKKEYFHFLGKAAWKVKNVKGAIETIKKTKKESLHILGGVRFNFKMGMRFTFSPRIQFHGMVGGSKKDQLIQKSKGLVFPIRWHEPFGLAITESLYYGCPVFATPYGSLSELVTQEVGFLSNKSAELADAIENVDTYCNKTCHEYARDIFNSKVMTQAYLKKYEQVLSGNSLNEKNPQLVKIQQEKYLDWG